MSDLLSGLLNQFGGSALSQMAQVSGGDEQKTQSALNAALPLILSALAKNTSTQEGAQKLNNALEKDHDGSILENVSGFLGGGSAESIGSAILGHVLGSKTSAVESAIAQKTGMDSGSVASIIKMAAPIVMGYLAKQKAQTGGGADMLSSILGSAVSSQKQAAPENQSFIESLLDQNKDGSVVDDVARMGMSFLGNMFKK